MKEFLNDKIIPRIMAFINTKALIALKDGLLYAMPMMIIGSVFLLLAFFPYQPIADWFTEVGLTPVLTQAYESTFNLMAMIAAIGIAYTYVRNEKFTGLPAGVISLCSFILIQPSAIATQTGTVGVILRSWVAGKGMIGAIIIGLFTGVVYTFFLKRNLTIKLPAGVPAGVANSFTALIPGFIIIMTVAAVYGACEVMLKTTPMELVYQVIQAPLQGMTDSFGGVLIMSFMIPFLWFFGVHGSTIVMGIMNPLLSANTAENQAILAAGKELTLENGAHIVTQQFLDNFVIMTGAGITIGIVIYLVCFGKSKQGKQIGKLSIGPAIFNINEPITFGVPIVLNPFMAVPFLLMPVITGTLQYWAIYLGICPMYGGVLAPWTTPPILSGLLVGGWRAALLQVVILILSTLVYFPFIRAVDKMYLKQEQAAEGEK